MFDDLIVLTCAIMFNAVLLIGTGVAARYIGLFVF